MEPADQEPGGHGHGTEKSLLPLKKRALNDSNSDRGSSPDDSDSSLPKKRRVDGCVGANENEDAGGREVSVSCHRRPVPAAVGANENEDAGGREVSVSRHRRPVPAAVGAVAAASPEPAAKGDALFTDKKWLKKGKWIPESSDAPEPPVKKLMHDGIRSFDQSNRRHAAAEAAAEAATARDEKDQSDVVPQLNAAADLGAALKLRLAELGATRPWFVYRKSLQKSDVCPNQNRLLVSCKRETGLEGCPITACFSPAEWRRVENKDAGLLVTALDRDGESQTLTCKFLDSNGGYRFITGWKDFLKRNGMQLDGMGRWTRNVDVELWAFRSHELPRQPLLDENGKPVKPDKGPDGKVDKELPLQVPDHFHPEGSLGLILLHHEHRRTHVERDDDDEDGMGPPQPVAREKGKKQRDKRDASAPAPASPVARRETRDDAGAEPSGPSETMSKDEMVDKYGKSMSDVLIGVMMLQGAISTERQDNADGTISTERRDNADGAISKERRDNTDGAISKERRDNVDGEHGA